MADHRRHFLAPPVTLINRTILASLSPRQLEQIHEIIEEMGVASARAQHLGAPVTNFRILETTDQNLYVAVDDEGKEVLGILKMGSKHLFIQAAYSHN